MITTVGKVLAFALVVMSFIGLGLALWLSLDRRDWRAEVDNLNKEIRQRQEDQAREEGNLRLILAEIQAGRRPMFWNIEADGAALKPEPLAVSQARQQLVDMEQINKKLQDEVNKLQVDHLQLISRLRDQRARTEAALADQKRLREEIEAHKFDDQVRPFRDAIAEARKAKEGAEAQQEALRPGLVNALAELAIALKRSEQLNQRLAELKKTP